MSDECDEYYKDEQVRLKILRKEIKNQERKLEKWKRRQKSFFYDRYYCSYKIALYEDIISLLEKQNY